MKKLQSEVKAAAEKQQTNAHHRESEGERWQASGAEADSERHLAVKGQSDPTTERKQPNSRRGPPENTQLQYASSHSAVSWHVKNMEQLGEFDETIWQQSVKNKSIGNKKKINSRAGWHKSCQLLLVADFFILFFCYNLPTV